MHHALKMRLGFWRHVCCRKDGFCPSRVRGTVPKQASPSEVRSLPRAQGAAYYAGMLAYYWVLVTPSVAFIFGAYLYLSVNLFHVHYDEAFSSLQIPHHKGFSRIHVTPEGDLHVYGLAIDQARYCFQ